MTLNAWGRSTHIDLFGCNAQRTRNADTIRLFSLELCDRIQMKRYGEPLVVWFGHDGKEGYSLVQLIETSCITAHFSEDDNSAYIDVFSCKEYDVDDVAIFCMNYFGAGDMSYSFLDRGRPCVD